jgi:hypothetical protein
MRTVQAARRQIFLDFVMAFVSFAVVVWYFVVGVDYEDQYAAAGVAGGIAIAVFLLMIGYQFPKDVDILRSLQRRPEPPPEDPEVTAFWEIVQSQRREQR